MRWDWRIVSLGRTNSHHGNQVVSSKVSTSRKVVSVDSVFIGEGDL